MTSQDDPPSISPTQPSGKPSVSNSWKWFMRISGVLAIALFLLPTFYVVKYYVFDAPREQAMVKTQADALNSGMHVSLPSEVDPDQIPRLINFVRSTQSDSRRVAAIHALGKSLEVRGISFQRPVETLLGKSTLSDLAVHESDPGVRQAAQEEIGKIAQDGVVVRR